MSCEWYDDFVTLVFATSVTPHGHHFEGMLRTALELLPVTHETRKMESYARFDRPSRVASTFDWAVRMMQHAESREKENDGRVYASSFLDTVLRGQVELANPVTARRQSPAQIMEALEKAFRERANGDRDGDESKGGDAADLPAVAHPWGPAVWATVHRIASRNPKKQLFNTFVDDLARVLPCRECSEHAAAHVSHHPPAEYVGDAVAWAYDYHNNVNERLGKPSPSLENVRERFRHSLNEGGGEGKGEGKGEGEGESGAVEGLEQRDARADGETLTEMASAAAAPCHNCHEPVTSPSHNLIFSKQHLMGGGGQDTFNNRLT